MQAYRSWWGSLVFALMLGWGGAAHAQSWRPALHDADELYDAAEDLHDRAERFGNYQAMQITSSLERLTADLYQLLKRNACPTDVLAMMNATGAALEEASALVALDCNLRADRKAQSELANAQRRFDATFEHIQCALRATLPNRPAYRAPTTPGLAPTWYQVTPPPPVVPYGIEVHLSNPAPFGRALPRVRIAAVK